MTKLEQKLLELGYEKDRVEYINNEPVFAIFIKPFTFCRIEAFISLVSDTRNLSIKYEIDGFKFQKVIDNLQQAFDIMKKDLEELRKYER